MKLTAEDIKRLWAGITKGGPDVCWEWEKAVSSNGGYGLINIGGKTVRAHRVVYFLMRGDLIAELEILHTCNNPPCCNPNHLIQDTHAANLQQAKTEGRLAVGKGTNSKVNLSEEAIRDILTSTASLRELGRKYHIYHKTVAQIKKEFELCQK